MGHVDSAVMLHAQAQGRHAADAGAGADAQPGPQATDEPEPGAGPTGGARVSLEFDGGKLRQWQLSARRCRDAAAGLTAGPAPRRDPALRIAATPVPRTNHVDVRPRRQDLDGRPAGRMARRQDPRADPHAALRLRRLRGRARLQHGGRHGHLPAARAHRAAVQQRQDPAHEDPVHAASR